MITFADLAEATKGELIHLVENRPVERLLTDSRKIIISSGAVFFAIKGERHDGHQFIPELYARGIRQFVLERAGNLDESILHNCNILRTKNSLLALQRLAGFRRKKFDIPVVAVTGSNGKTIVKEWLYEALSQELKVVKSPRSYNSQLGVPLSVWQMDHTHEMGIFEAGISRPGEMESLCSVIQPTIGIITNIGAAHDEGFSSRTEKIREKIKLFASCKTILYCKDYPDIHEALVNDIAPDTALFSWARKEPADIILEKVETEENFSRLTLRYDQRMLHFDAPFSDHASVENCMHCIAFLLYEDFSHTFIQKQLNKLTTISMRLELKQGVNGSYLIDDSYSADLASLHIALDFLQQQKQKEKKTAILSDILQSGKSPAELYQSVANLLQSKNVDRLIGIGPEISSHKTLFSMPAVFYSSTEEFLKRTSAKDFADELILIKGARVFEFEKIVDRLQQKIHGAILEIDLDALVNNLNFYKSKLSPGVKLMTMVKAFAYGSGITEIAHLLQYHGVDYLAVAYVDEGVVLRESGIEAPIMVMNPSPEGFGKIVDYNLEPEIYSLRILKSLLDYTGKKPVSIHIKLDTGMHRLGFKPQDFEELIRLLKTNPQIKPVSIFSHMAGADEEIHDAYTERQIRDFSSYSEEIVDALSEKPLRHILNSSGIVRFPHCQFDMVRLGIGLYGVGADEESRKNLAPISSLKTHISQINELAPGDTVGYGRNGKIQKPSRIATIDIGYADGFYRAFGNGAGVVLVNGKRAPVVGNVCMDMAMIDITGIEAEEGDEAIIFGKDLSIEEVAARINTIPYEILTNVGDRVKRIFFTE